MKQVVMEICPLLGVKMEDIRSWLYTNKRQSQLLGDMTKTIRQCFIISDQHILFEEKLANGQWPPLWATSDAKSSSGGSPQVQKRPTVFQELSAITPDGPGEQGGDGGEIGPTQGRKQPADGLGRKKAQVQRVVREERDERTKPKPKLKLKPKPIWNLSSQEERKTASLTYATSILFFMTPKTQDELTELLKQLRLHPDNLAVLIQRIFEMALLVPQYYRMYAILCASLSNEKNSRAIARQNLLIMCEKEFLNRQEQSQQPESELIDKKEKQKRHLRLQSNMQFIGKLFLLKLIPENVVWKCFHELFSVTNPDETKMECFCKLMTVIGKRIDVPGSKIFTVFDSVFQETLPLLLLNTQLGSDVCKMIVDLIDLRRSGWIPLVERSAKKPFTKRKKTE